LQTTQELFGITTGFIQHQGIDHRKSCLSNKPVPYLCDWTETLELKEENKNTVSAQRRAHDPQLRCSLHLIEPVKAARQRTNDQKLLEA
jgi:hypothetical protein